MSPLSWQEKGGGVVSFRTLLAAVPQITLTSLVFLVMLIRGADAARCQSLAACETLGRFEEGLGWGSGGCTSACDGVSRCVTQCDEQHPPSDSGVTIGPLEESVSVDKIRLIYK